MYEVHWFFDKTYSTCVHFRPYYQVGNWTLLSSNPSGKLIITIFNIKIDSDGPRSRSRHLCAPNHHPKPFEHIKFRIFVVTLPRPSKSCFFFREIKIKNAGGCYKLNVTEIFLNHLPIDRTPKGFVQIHNVGWEMYLWSRVRVYTHSTVQLYLNFIYN